MSKDRMTPEKDGRVFDDPVAAGARIFAGALVCLDAAGNLVPGSASATLTARGRAHETVDNSGGAVGDLTCNVRRGVFRFDNSSSGDEITRAEIGDDCYIVDDHTVAKTDGGSSRPVAGEIMDVDTAGVWVRI